jgi:hypothetical protein
MRNRIHRNRRRKYCGEGQDRKLCHLTREDAAHFMAVLLETTGSKPQPLSAYLHKACGEWHVGHCGKAVREKFHL